MSKILCLYYSKSGSTRMAMEKITELLGAELVQITDGKKRKGLSGFFTSGFDATKKTPEQLEPFHTELPLSAYDHVILGTPVWAGRCSSIMRSFLISYGKELPENVSYVITHMGVNDYEQIYTQMDQYLKQPHVMGLSLQPKADDYHQKVYNFMRAIAAMHEEIIEEEPVEEIQKDIEEKKSSSESRSKQKRRGKKHARKAKRH